MVDSATRAARKAERRGEAPSAAMAAASGGATSGGFVVGGAAVMLIKVALSPASSASPSAALGVAGVGLSDDACKYVEEDSVVVARVVVAGASPLGVSPVVSASPSVSLCAVECCCCL